MKPRGVKSFIFPADVTPFQLGIAENLAAKLCISGLMRLKYTTPDEEVIATRFGDTTIIKTKSLGGYPSIIFYNIVTKLNDMYDRTLKYYKSFGLTKPDGYVTVVDITKEHITCYYITSFPYIKSKYLYERKTLKYDSGFDYPDQVIDMGGNEYYMVLAVWDVEWDTDNGILKHLADPQKQDGTHVLTLFLYTADAVYTGKSVSFTCTNAHFKVPMNMHFDSTGMYIVLFDSDVVDIQELGYVYPDPPPDPEHLFVYDHRTFKTIVQKYDYNFSLINEVQFSDNVDFATGSQYEFIKNFYSKKYGKIECERWYRNDLIGDWFPIPMWVSVSKSTNKVVVCYDHPHHYRWFNAGYFDGEELQSSIETLPITITIKRQPWQWDYLGMMGSDMWYMIGIYLEEIPGWVEGSDDNRTYIMRFNSATMKWADEIKTVAPNTGYYYSGVAGDF